ncbi:hypothetical protein CYLTODRAFT_420292 [Cylindrobasidium torrendii FP15055 ss-10]|uniref:Uncharacterized protein n=1 Tax=Cylindrobasidium torrendii FP15055 ss-10 TaxID=1314674 RepID=A0A0D7BJQ8_9AGAR|nr:hypothetical protein CYLTODRAFT_420292 [Cylindrobasidium torrendii FP15055 ss-10]
MGLLYKLPAILLLPALSVGVRILLKPNLVALVTDFVPQCRAATSPYYMPITSGTVPRVESMLCTLLSVFHLAMEDEHANAFLGYFGTTWITPLLLFTSLESSRKNRQYIVSLSQLFFGFASQLFTLGVVMPWYFLYFIVFLSDKQARPTTQRQAEASIFGVLVGWTATSVAMTRLTSPTNTTIFQFAPIIAFLAQEVYLSLRASTKPGYPIVKATYILFFFAAAAKHIATAVVKFHGDLHAFGSFMVPTLHADSLAGAALNVFQLDFWAVAIAGGLATMWFARSQKQLIGLVLWSVLGGTVFGSGAAFCAAALWRESTLETVVESKERKD